MLKCALTKSLFIIIALNCKIKQKLVTFQRKAQIRRFILGVTETSAARFVSLKNVVLALKSNRNF